MSTGLFVGLATLDVIQLVDSVPAPNEKTTARQSWLAAGGPAAVAAVAFAALGGAARLLTVLGDGPAAAVVRADLGGTGVQVLDAAPTGFELAPSVALVDAANGERAVVSGSAQRPSTLRPPELDLADVDVVLLDGHHPELALAAARAASAAGIPVVVDAGSHKPVFADLWQLVTDVICSSDYEDPAGRPPEALLDEGLSLVAVSHGGDPLQWWTADGSGDVAAPAVQVVDTLGAGDVLHGAYCHALASSGAPRPHAASERVAALGFAVRAASARVSSLGPFAWRAAVRSTGAERRRGVLY